MEFILKRVANAKYYSVQFDETTDLSGRSQVCLSLRYIDERYNLREDFVEFVDAFGELKAITSKKKHENEESDSGSSVAESDDDEPDPEETDHIVTEYSLTGENSGKIILKKMKEMNLELKHCVGIGTDGCPTMLGGNSGAVKEVQKEAVNAVQTPCYSHKLNNSLLRSSTVPTIEKTNSVMKEVTQFFYKMLPKRNVILAQFLGKKLKMLCETRWVERHDSVLQFMTDLPGIIQGLERISKWKYKETASKANALLHAITNGEFLIGLYCLGDILSLTHPLSILLQRETIDLGEATEVINSLISLLETRRNGAAEHFERIFLEAKTQAEDLDIEIKVPRLCGRQTQRSNYHRLRRSDKMNDFTLIMTDDEEDECPCHEMGKNI